MWTEPLAARTEEAGQYAFDVVVAEGGGRDVARVRCAINRNAGCGVFGAMEVLDADASARQRMRALTLSIREALRHGAAIGITDVAADVPPRLATLVSRVSGMTAASIGGQMRYRGLLHAVRTRALDETDSDGNLVRALPGDDGAIAQAVP
jgi:hypothetical protein